MSYPTPRQTPERQLPQPSPSPSTPRKSRILAVISSPIKLLGGLGSPTAVRSVGLPRRRLSPPSEDDSDNEAQGTASSRNSSESGLTERTKNHFYERALAPFRSSRQRQEARLRRVRNVIRFIERIKDEGYLGRKEAIPMKLLPKDYIDLLLEIDNQDLEFQSFFQHRIRYEYRESRYGDSQFTIFMASAFHKRISFYVSRDVVNWCDWVRDGDNPVEVVRAVENIEAGNDEGIETDKTPLYPDCCFKYEEATPSLVFEIAWSQTTEDLKRKALELIRETKGEVQTVVGLDFYKTYNAWSAIRGNVGTEELPNRGPATAFVWRAIFDENGRQLFNADGQPRVQKKSYRFCDNDGKALPGANLKLTLRDFIPLQVISTEGWGEAEALDTTVWEFDSAKMIEFFDKGLKAQKAEDKSKQPRKIRAEQKKNQEKQAREANQAAVAEREQRRWTIRDVSNIGGYSLRRSARRDRVAGGVGQEGG
ncbi:hypothetical protein GGR51DRAFT_258718 [Nemania sp. FL0031]|nr:hypothetical protein GGR51DRAFT_258718 [Nemania sp. FL0031]